MAVTTEKTRKRKTTSKKTTAKKQGQPAKAGAAPKSDAMAATPEMRQQMIAEAAYYKAEARGFSEGDSMADWLAAEQEVDTILAGSGRH